MGPDDLASKRRAKKMPKKTVAYQYGFTHVWCALIGQEFVSKIDLELVGGTPQMLMELLQYEQRIQQNRPIIIGHNMLWDLCFLMNTFSGVLPDREPDFARMVRDKMPRIVDTKYLFTRGHDDMMPDQSLSEYFMSVKNQVYPRVSNYRTYSKPALHEAGYNSEYPAPFREPN